MQTAHDYDVVVIGAGPAGEGAAMKLSKEGKKVAIVDARGQVGGNCTHVGTIPSKALRQTVFNIMRYQRDVMFQRVGELRNVPLSQVLARAHTIIEQQVAVHSRFYDRNEVDVYYGQAHFVDAQHLSIKTREGGTELLSFASAVLATGSRPYHPEDIDFSHPRVFDSDKILTLDYPVHKLIIYGAGVIGCEYASIFVGLGYKVDLINTQVQLLSYLDDEIADALSYYLRELGVLIRHQEQYERVETFDDCVVLHLKSGKKIKADAILWCNGRTGNTDNLALEAVGLQANSRGQITVDQQYKTAIPHIFAAGDVIGWPSLASAAYDQGRCAAAHILGVADTPRVEDVPTGIYTIPEISSLGKTEKQLTEERVPYEVGQAFFRHLARAQITGETVGMLKILFHRETLAILGIHCFGNNAAEIVHIGQAIMQQKNGGNTLRYFANTTFNYPTMAEAYRVAALNGLNRLF
ncbi:Si-specific NAD(P)(+) transhydrogenase [Agitococcus lubricus]|uniref:Soluble pyridine nucleotide transhydrogenase n=1 Tax=Agitococcus lubricus TaxID=1077255 RepID=A0A2T5IVM2_9GAMM|nr:Si-specific NAD(P)(+) transhydrogenase [Agitococcus lubricus]PTQ87936.1 NAD(P) transhydrogenase [Agitococcus lubricus]